MPGVAPPDQRRLPDPVIALRWCRDDLLASPIIASVHALVRQLAPEPFPDLHSLNALAKSLGLASASGASIRFVDPLPPARGIEDSYEMRVWRDGAVATRPDNWHDLFNALAWCAFPRTKACLNALHCEDMQARGDHTVRGPLRDFLTLFDEGGAFAVSTDPALLALMREHEWRALFVTRRADVCTSMHFAVIGHAVMEKALDPWPGVTSRTLLLDAPAQWMDFDATARLAWMDAAGADALTALAKSGDRAAFGALPILGVPGWIAANEDARYYDDATHFRPRRRR